MITIAKDVVQLYLKIGASVRYKPEDVVAWLESRPSGGGQMMERL
jgi:hypothetical protein